ncbi:DUF6468 domain-containing protein [Curvivirga aplysinae]|uniref:DUF6468 domain-containing protein n=1 Tax=Curvivirga aplysinae TaxID=2529852 RepID=UPI0012BCBB8A|nr:DUF6468 domain-containing protein [Curvivirga aplysinae]MTI10600.1 hypothetical protein [Curvivirga aplysinae]
MKLDLLEATLDIAFIGLLIAVLIYAVRLNRNIRILQDSKEELRQLLGQFVSSTQQAEEALLRIKNRSRDATETIDDAIAEAKTLRADLIELIRRAQEVAGPVGIAAAKVERGQATYNPGYSTGPAKGKKARSKKAKSAKATPASPREPMNMPDITDMDAEIDKDLEARLSKLIESVEAGNPEVMAPQADMFGAESSAVSSAQEAQEAGVELSGVDEAQESKAKSKEELLKALRGMR